MGISARRRMISPFKTLSHLDRLDSRARTPSRQIVRASEAPSVRRIRMRSRRRRRFTRRFLTRRNSLAQQSTIIVFFRQVEKHFSDCSARRVPITISVYGQCTFEAAQSCGSLENMQQINAYHSICVNDEQHLQTSEAIVRGGGMS